MLRISVRAMMTVSGDLMQTRDELYELLDYDPAHPEAWRQRMGIAPEE